MFTNPTRAAQLINFQGLKYGNCSPTDLDLTIEWKGLTFAFCELKLKGTPLTIGQRLYLSNTVNAINDGGRHAVALFAEHEVDDPSQDVIAAEAIVSLAYGKDKQWVNVKAQGWTLGEYLEKVYRHHLDRNNLSY